MYIDWISVTFKVDDYTDMLAKLEQLCGEIVVLEYGGRGYDCSGVVWGSGRVYWSDKRPEMGVHVSLPSGALAQSGKNSDYLLSLFRQQWGGKFTRLDLAMDDVMGVLNLDTVIGCARSRWYVSRWKQWQLNENSLGGRTLTFGSRSSESYLRIYDKRLEQIIKSEKDTSIDVSCLPDVWTRVELELKDDRATAAVDGILEHFENVGEIVSGWLYSMLDFKIENLSDENKSRWDTSEWWVQFLGFVQKMKLVTPKKVPSFDKLYEWVVSQVAPSLFVLKKVLGDRKSVV